MTGTERIHDLKLDMEFCDAVFNGDKTFEMRLNDRGYQKGDFIKFVPVEGTSRLVTSTYHPIKDALFEITYVLNGYGLKEDFVCLAIKRVKVDDNRFE